MEEINLQDKTEALPGKIESYWFENPNIGLKRTQFHSIEIPLTPFESGLPYGENPVETVLVFDCFELKINDETELDGLNLSHANYPESEASVYIGDAHNWCVVEYLKVEKISDNEFKLNGEVLIEFENEMVAKNERFKFSAISTYSKRDQ